MATSCDTEAILRICDLTVRYDGGNDRPALRGVSLTLCQGDFLAVVGPNGSGKSTLLRALNASVKGETTGEISWRGRPVTREAPHRRATTLAKVDQDPNRGTAAHLSLLEHCTLTSLSRGKRAVSWRRISEALDSVGTPLNPSDQIRNLSGGQRQLFTVLLTVLSEPELLLLDEPTSALDRRHTELVLRAIETYASVRERTTVMATHDLDEAVRCGNRILVLNARGEPEAHLENSDPAQVTRETLARLLIAASTSTSLQT